MGDSEHEAVTRFRDYLRINTGHPNPNYDLAVKWLKQQAQSIGLPMKTITLSSGLPVVIITWEGSNKDLKSMLFNSHMDVVPVYPDKWIHPPFDAFKTADGKIYARGSQDMKCVGIWHLEALRNLKAEGYQPIRTVHLSFVPDEELSGHRGMQIFVKTSEFEQLNIGYALDEGLCDPSPSVAVYYGERVPAWIKIHIHGNPGHGSQFIQGTAAEKAMRFIGAVMDYRQNQQKKLEADPSLFLGDVNTVNINLWEGGVQMNVIPSEIVLGLDFRMSPKSSLSELDCLLQSWVQLAGDGIVVEFVHREDIASMTPTNDSCPFFKAFKSACAETGCVFRPEIFPAATDSRYLRTLGIKALGFTPAPNTPILLHDHNEYLEESVFLNGLVVMTAIVKALSSVN